MPDETQNVAALDPGVSAAPPAPAAAAAPGLGDWSDAFSWPIIGIHSVLTPDGKVLTFGTDQNGVQGGQMVYDVYDPVTGTHSTLVHTTHTDIFCSVALIVPSTGEILIAGGDARPQGTVNAGVPDVNVYDFEDMGLESSPTGPMEYARWYATMLTLANGQLVALGGRDGNFEYNGYSEIYTENSGWRTLTGAYIEEFANLSNYPRTWVASSGKIITFSADSGAATVYAIDPSGSGSVEAVGQLPFATAWMQPATMFDVDRALILADDGTAWIMDISGGTPVFTQTDSVGPDRKWSNLVLLPDGKVMLSGGSAVDASSVNELVDVNYLSAIWDPDTGQWTDVDDAAVPRLYHSTTLLMPDGTVLSLGGGAPGPVTNLNGETYSPDYLFDATGAAADRPVITSAPGELEAGDQFTVAVDDPDSVETLALLAFGATTHSFNMSARRIELTFTKQADGTLSVDLPDNVNVLTPGYWMLFAIDANGTPSIASTIHIGVEQAPYMPSTLALDLGVPLETNGLAAYDGYEDAYVLTPDAQFKAGSVMSEERVDLRQEFSISFEFNVGADDAGADGLAFVLHNDPAGARTLGFSGGGFGALGILNGLGIEFDIYDSSVVYPEPAADHTNIFDTDDLTSDPAITGPTELANLEDGLWHKVDVAWNGTDTLSYTVDGIAVGSWTGDIFSTFLAGSPLAYFGFTGGTGGATAQQQVRVLTLDATAEDGTDFHADRGDLPVAPEISTHGDASFDALANEYVLTPNAEFKTGSVTIDQRIDLSQSFNLIFQFNVGDNDAAADGLAFVMHNDPAGAAALGHGGGALGAIGIQNGLGIEFDIYQNTEIVTELTNDHTVIFDTDVVGTDPSVSAATDLGNIEDGRWHTVAVTWNGQALSYSVDGIAIATLTADIAATYLGGSQFAFLGITGATGGATTEQKVRIVEFDGTAEDGTALHIIGPNSAPVAQDDTYTVESNGVLTVSAALGVIANDSDPDGDPLSICDNSHILSHEQLLAPEHGALVMNADGSFSYTPDAGFVGIDHFVYCVEDEQVCVDGEVTIVVNGGGPGAPVAVADSYSVAEDGTLTVPAVGGVLSNDSDPDNDPLQAVLVAGPAHGALTLSADGSFVYTPTANFNGSDSITYRARDGATESDIVTVSLAVTPVNDAPVITSNGGAPLSIALPENTGTALTTIMSSDIDSGSLSYSILGGSDAARFTIDPVMGTLAFAMPPDFESPGDVGADNVYEVAVQVSDGSGGSDSQAISVIVANITGATIAGSGAGETLTGTGEEDTISGFGGSDTLIGLGGNDTLDGGSGNDVLNGGAGSDVMRGGTGNDTFAIDSAGDVVTEDAGQGTDTVQTTIAAYTLGQNLENLTSTGTGAFSGLGNSLANTITGGAGNDTLDGAAGVDKLTGGLGEDTYKVDNASDVVVEATKAGTDLVLATSASYTLSNNVENLTFAGAGSFSGMGNGSANTITGGAAADRLSGGGGTDTLLGLAGNDTLSGGSGADRLDGGPGGDSMTGGTGNDLYVVDAAGDTVIENAGDGTDTVETSLASYTLGANIENLTFAGTGSFAGTGNTSANTVTGGASADALSGGSGNDRIIGGAGNDTIAGGAGNDTIVFNPGFGNDVITDFGDVSGNNDIIQFSTSVFADFAAVQQAIAQVGADIVISATVSDLLTIKNKTVATLGSNDFSFA